MNPQLFEIIKWLTPVAIFILGFVIDAQIKRIRESRNRKLKREFVFFSIDNLVERNKKQVKEIERVLKNLEDVNSLEILVSRVTGTEFSDLDENNTTDYYNLFILKRKGDKDSKLSEYRAFRDNLAFIEELYPAIFSMNKETFDRIIHQIEIFNKSYFDTVNSVNEFVNAHNRNNENKEDTFITSCTTILKSIYENHGKIINDIDIIYTQGILKLKEACKQYKSDKRTIRLLEIVHQAEASFLTIQVNKKQEIVNLGQKLRQLVDSNDSLSKAINNIKKGTYKY